jgi:diacylglycerol kinase (ATP)
MMTKPDASGVKKLINSTIYSWRGLSAAWRNEEAFRLELCLAVLFLPLSYIVADTLAHQLILVLVCVLVVLAELINTAIESVVDRIGPEHHPLSAQAKDIGSAIVLITLGLFWLIWGPSLWQYYNSLG